MLVCLRDIQQQKGTFNNATTKKFKENISTAKFDLHPELPNGKPNGLFSCTDCIYHKNGYIKPCKSFVFKVTNEKSVTCNYNEIFDCDSKDVLYILICNNCDYFYLGKTIDFKQRIRKHKSDVKHPQSSTCREYAENLRNCAKIEPFFRFIRFIMKKIIPLATTKKNDLLLMEATVKH